MPPVSLVGPKLSDFTYKDIRFLDTAPAVDECKNERQERATVIALYLFTGEPNTTPCDQCESDKSRGPCEDCVSGGKTIIKGVLYQLLLSYKNHGTLAISIKMT
ncbi:hypothetical protein F5X99DRAFT_52909 [Biscogniauxia marginata]|nr:hypothetical protein F5X99DRAFT_52909 [Biscogniauxia marginata]